MKLKFTAEAQEVIDLIAVMPVEAIDAQQVMAPVQAIRSLNQKLMAEKTRGKYWTKIRRELSFFYSMQITAEKKHQDPAQRYSDLVKFFKSMKDETALQVVSFVQLALSYGIIRLSDFEVQRLIDGNKG